MNWGFREQIKNFIRTQLHIKHKAVITNELTVFFKSALKESLVTIFKLVTSLTVHFKLVYWLPTKCKVKHKGYNR